MFLESILKVLCIYTVHMVNIKIFRGIKSLKVLRCALMHFTYGKHYHFWLQNYFWLSLKKSRIQIALTVLDHFRFPNISNVHFRT